MIASHAELPHAATKDQQNAGSYHEKATAAAGWPGSVGAAGSIAAAKEATAAKHGSTTVTHDFSFQVACQFRRALVIAIDSSAASGHYPAFVESLFAR
jgi:hypothetical protein